MKYSVQEELWASYLEQKSIFKHYPAIISLIPFILGSIFWRVSQVQWNWYRRELLYLPHGIIFLIGTLIIFRSSCWRFLLVLRKRPYYFILLLLIFLGGFYYTDYHWKRTAFPFHLPDKTILEETFIMEGQLLGYDGVEEQKWIVKSERIVLKSFIEMPIPQIQGKILVVSPEVSSNSVIQVGDHLLFMGKLLPFSKATNPGQFDYQRFQRYSGFCCQMIETQVYFKFRPSFNFSRWIDMAKKRASDFFLTHISESSYPLVMVLLTGEKDYLDDLKKNQIQNLGLSHLLAISGLHLGLVVIGLKKILLWLRVSPKYTPWILIIGIWFAVIFVGCPPSALRVGIYLTLTQFGGLLRQPIKPLNLLGVTAFIILIINPLTLFLVGFQLSFSVYLSILLLYQPIFHGVSIFFKETSLVGQKVKQSLSLSIAAFLGSAPLVLFHFFQLPLQGILINLLAVPLIGIILALILISLIVGLISPLLGSYLTVILDLLVCVFNQLICFFNQKFPEVWQPGRPLMLWIAIFYLTIWVLWRWFEKRSMPIFWKRKKIGLIYQYLTLIIIIGVGQFITIPENQLEWVLLDVGQGDGMFIKIPAGPTMLIDGGGKPGVGDKNYTGENILKPFLLSRGIKTIDLLCVTHFDADHVKGLLTILEKFDVKSIWAPYGSQVNYALEMEKLARMKGIPIYHPVRGQVLEIGNGKIEILHPEFEVNYENENDRSLVFRLKFQGIRILLTGDLGEKEEKKLVDDQIEIESELLKVGHHGSKFSTSPSFLQKVNPFIALISVGKNRYGHPAESIINRLKASGSQIWRTDESGAIQILIHEKEISIKKFRE
ncbi:MAG: DNA internalization-related competence protein ComEC/Rec2 [Halanaerobiales bacterium]|nr:DNA internalization-related competence protein ComEC/Rec2 [Halanaerobiales bacterium]